MRIHLFTTTIVDGRRSDALSRLIRSLTEFREANPGQELNLHLLLQKADDAALVGLPDWVDARIIDTKVSLSKARNILLSGADESVFSSSTLVAFPDDDAWYPEGLIEGVLALFEDPALDFFFCRYAAAPEKWTRGPVTMARSKDVARGASSNTIFLRGGVVGRVGRFDEDLGAGARYNGGEDTDYALRSYSEARKTLASPGRHVGHRDPDRSLRGVYYVGALRAVAAHAFRHPSDLGMLLRKIAVGAYFVVTGHLSAGRYLRDLSGLRRLLSGEVRDRPASSP